MNDSRIDAGRRGESLALEFLVNRGYRPVARNFRFRRGEIDLVVEAPEGDLVFVEVKSSRGDVAGDPLAWVSPRKQRQLQRVAQGYCLVHPSQSNRSMRFDVMAVDLNTEAPGIRHIPNAFLPATADYFR